MFETTFVECFFGGQPGKLYTFRTSLKNLKKDDLILVASRPPAGFDLATVVRVFEKVDDGVSCPSVVLRRVNKEELEREEAAMKVALARKAELRKRLLDEVTRAEEMKIFNEAAKLNPTVKEILRDLEEF